MARKRTTAFNPQTFLSKVGSGKTSLTPSKKQVLYSQGDAADAVFYIQGGKVKLTVVSQQGREAIVAILEQGSFFGESCLAGQTVRTATATALENASLVHPRGFGRSTLQFQREAAGPGAVDPRQFWQGPQARAGAGENQPGDAG